MTKTIQTLLIILVAPLLLAGQKTFTVEGDSRIRYELDRNREENDSIVAFFQDDELTICNSIIVTYKAIKMYDSFQKGDSCITNQYWKNGQLKQRDIYVKDNNVLSWLYVIVYCENGTLRFSGPSPNVLGKKKYINYHCNGQKQNEFFHQKTGADGKMLWWYENGKLKSEFYFDNNTPIGIWKYWNENGTLNREESYDNGKLIETINHMH